jgi:type IV pilus assembly protein PilO
MDLGIDKIAKWPVKQKIALLVLLLAAEGALLWFPLLQPKFKELQETKAKLSDIQNQVLENRAIAAKLPVLQREYDRLSKELESALTELPNQKEIPALLTTVTDEGKKAGLDFLVFRPRNEEPKEFYAAVPVDITVSGSFSSVGNFFVSVSNMPRIMNISNVEFSDIKASGDRTTLKVTCLATTFRFLDKKEQQK